MRKIFTKKTVATAAATLSILFGSVTAFASSSLGSNIIFALRASFDVRMDDYKKSIHTEQQELVGKNKIGISEYVNNSSEHILGNVENYIQEELSRADSELDSYKEELFLQLDQELLNEEERLKNILKQYVDSKIKSSKDELNNEVYKEFHNRLREYLGQ